MQTNQQINLKRLYQRMKCELFQWKKSLIISTITLVLIFLFFSVNPLDAFTRTLIIGGIVMATLAFREIHEPKQAQFHLALPCSQFEYFLSKWLFTTIGAWLYAGIVTALYVISMILLPSSEPMPYETVIHITHWLVAFMSIHAMFFLGSVTFSRRPFIKTSLIIVAILYIMLRLGGYLLEFSTFKHLNLIMNVHSTQFAVWAVLFACFLWTVSYLKLKEKEA